MYWLIESSPMRWLLLLALSTTSCIDKCWVYHYDWGFDYQVEPNHTTDYGIRVDTSGVKYSQEIFDMMDQMTIDVESCLAEEFPDGKNPDGGWCQESQFSPKTDKECLQVKIPKSWHLSEETGHQLLKDVAPGEGCKAKGLDASDGCYWRAGLQDGCKVITTPNLYLYKDPLIKFITTCDNVWYVEKFAKCASPKVEPTWADEILGL